MAGGETNTSKSVDHSWSTYDDTTGWLTGQEAICRRSVGSRLLVPEADIPDAMIDHLFQNRGDGVALRGTLPSVWIVLTKQHC